MPEVGSGSAKHYGIKEICILIQLRGRTGTVRNNEMQEISVSTASHNLVQKDVSLPSCELSFSFSVNYSEFIPLCLYCKIDER